MKKGSSTPKVQPRAVSKGNGILIGQMNTPAPTSPRPPGKPDDIRFRVEAARVKRGQYLAAFLVLNGYVLIAFAIHKGATVIGTAVAGTLLVSVITGFVRSGGKRCARNECDNNKG